MKSHSSLVSPAICVLAGLALSGLAQAQTFPRIKPLPEHWATGSRAAARLAQPGSSPWQALNNQPTFLSTSCYGAANPLLLTDGTVIIQDGGCSDWWRLTPDNTGSYVNGTWTQIASLPAGYAPLYHSSAVLPDGRLIIEGGEYNLFSAVWTNLGVIYDPLADAWTPVNPPSGWNTIGDAQSVVLPSGVFMQANCCTRGSALLNPHDLTWKDTGFHKFDPNDEEGWNLLPNGLVLAVDAYVPIPPFSYHPNGTHSELYNPATGDWSSAGSTVVQLWDSAAACGGLSVATFELGPGVLRPDGTVFYMGANSCGAAHTSIYDSYAGTWTPGPDFPDALDIADGPAALEPNGKVLMMASPGFGLTPSTFLEWDGRSLTIVPGTPNAPNDSSFYGNMLVLPTGQILLTDFSTDIEVYNPAPAWNLHYAPVVEHAPAGVTPGMTYDVIGYGFNGVSQGAAYGDDVQAATNFPLVRITNNKTGHVFYSRTHDHSSMAVASPELVKTHFDVTAGQELGDSTLEVVVNGVASQPVPVVVHN
jgi:hypothetical protein